jgi:hypothetical protein
MLQALSHCPLVCIRLLHKGLPFSLHKLAYFIKQILLQISNHLDVNRNVLGKGGQLSCQGYKGNMHKQNY